MLNSLSNIGNDTASIAKALAELQGFTISGPITGAAAATAMAVTGIETEDTIKAVIVQDTTSKTLTNDTANVSIVDRRSTGTITLSGLVAGDVIGVNGKNYTAVADPGYNGAIIGGQFKVKGTDALTAAELAKAIMQNDSTLEAKVLSGAIVTIWYRTAGTGGNAIALAVTGSNSHATRSAATLAGGTATSGITSTTNLTGKEAWVLWFNKQ